MGCNKGGYLNESKFSEPMPWIGIYVAAASLVCSMAMGADAFLGFRYGKFWFPCKFFSLNATSLTLIGVAVKLSVDLNTPMPRHEDQLAKLSSAVLICTVMGNSMPSIGSMHNKEIFMNVMALVILVITLAVNICIQLATGTIYVFWIEHVVVMVFMLVLLVILSFSALVVPTTKHYFERKYLKKHELAVKEGLDEIGKSVVQKLKDDLRKYWMMAHTCCPQFVMGRSVTCTASGAFCLLAAVTLAEAMVRSYLMPASFKFCSGESDYKWSITLVLITQTIAVGVGTIAPALRWLIAIKFRCPKKGKKRCKFEFEVEHYWIQRLVELKECPLAFHIHGRYCRKLAHDIKDQLLGFCIGMQIGIVLMSKLIRLSSILIVSQLLSCIQCCKEMNRRIISNNSISNNDSRSESPSSPKQDLSRFVMHLEGEEPLVEVIMKKNCNATEHWIRMGKKQQPNHLVQLLQKSSSSQAFKGVKVFDSEQVPSLDSEEPPNCWALPVVTLASVALALPNINHCLVKQLIRSINEGLMYTRFIEKALDANEDLKNIRNAADLVWLGVDLYHKWLDEDLHKMALQTKSLKEILEGLANIAKDKFMELKKRSVNDCLRDIPSKWPIKVIAANSMYRVSQTLLLNYKDSKYQMGERLFEELSLMISDIFGACLTNLPQVISKQCFLSTYEEREESVRQAIFLLGKTEKILKILDKKVLPSLNPDQMASIDEWRVLEQQKYFLPFISSSDCDAGPCDLYLSIE